MDKIGIFYCSLSGNTRLVAEIVQSNIQDFNVDVFDISEVDGSLVSEYKYLIFGISTWQSNEMPKDWKIFLEACNDHNLNNKKIALYGLGDQVIFKNAFVNTLGHVYLDLKSKNADVIGYWPIEGYRFTSSLALKDGQFVGLVLDEENQSEQTESRINQWLSAIIPYFN